MKLIVGLFVGLFLLLEFFGHVRINGFECAGIARIILSGIGAALLAFIIGLPVLGILALLGL